MSDRSAWTKTEVAYDAYLREAPGLALRTGPDLYPSIDLAIQSLDWLTQHLVVVLCFDGFTTDGQYLDPSMNHIADFSELLLGDSEWTDRVGRSVSESRRVLTAWRGQVQFVDMVIESEDDPPPAV
jgi:hypothetical protein